MARLNLELFYYPQNPHSLQFLPQTGHHICYGPQHTQIGASSLGFSQLCSQVFVIFEPGPCLIQRHSLYGLGPVSALALVFLFGAFILIPGGGTFFCLGAASLTAAFAPSGAVFLVITSKELAFTALQLQLLAFFGEVFSAAVEAFVIATLGSINIHGIRVPCLGPFYCS